MNIALFTWKSDPSVKLIRTFPDMDLIRYIAYAHKVNTNQSIDSKQVTVKIIRGNHK